MPTTSTGSPSPVDEVGDALIALHRATEHPFDMTFEDGQFIATYQVQPGRSDGSTYSTYRYCVRLLPENGEYRRLTRTSTRTSTGGSGTWRFNSRWVTGPVDDTLAAHGWKPRRTALGKLFRRVLAMPS
jgi:hypothetical protein